MEMPTARQQWTLALLGFYLVFGLLVLYISGSGLVPTATPVGVVATIALTVALGFFSLALVWWGNRWGYVGAMVTGLIPAITIPGSFLAMAAGNLPAELLILNLPGWIFALALIYAAFLAWRE